MAVAERSYAKSFETFSQYLVPRLRMQDAICGGRHILVLTGEMDMASCPALGAALAHICTGETNAVVLDLRKVTFLDSTGVKTIFDARNLSAQHGCEFSLIRGQASVQRVFEVCGLLDDLPFRDDGSCVDPESSGGRSLAGRPPDPARGARSPSPRRAMLGSGSPDRSVPDRLAARPGPSGAPRAFI
jgi:anti-anti-sigma factor